METVERLRAHGLRVTRPRVAALDVLSAGGHLTVDEVRTGVGERIGAVSVQAMYDVLGALADARLVRRIEPAGSPTRYEGRAGDNHHHLVCRGCGRVVDVDCVVGEPPCMQPTASADTAGFTIDEAEVTFWGLCPECQRASAGPGSA